MAEQLARGIFANFDSSENPWTAANGMEANLRLIDDHLGLYTMEPPLVVGAPLPGVANPGDGQIYADGTYAVFNAGSWKVYPARRGIRAMLLDGSEAWTNNGAGWSQYSVLDTSAATEVAVAAQDAALIASATADAYPNTAAANVPRGLTQASVGAITPGAGGANGTFPLGWAGGNFAVNPTGTFTVVGGALTAVTITGPGLYIGAAPAVPAPSFAASAGLAGANVVLTAQFLVAAGKGYWVQSADGKTLNRYYNNGGVATADAGVRPIPTVPYIDERFGFPRYRAAYGIVNNPAPAQMLSGVSNQATITNDGRFGIPAGVGKKYFSRPSDHINMSALAVGDKILFFVNLDDTSGTINTPTVLYQPGNVTVNFVNDVRRRWVAELTVPPGGLTSLVVEVVSSDAGNPVTGEQLCYAIAPVAGKSYFQQQDARALEGWIQSGMQEGVGNLWPAEYQSFPVAAADGSETLRAWGVTVDAGETLFGMFYIEDSDGEPAIVDRVFVRASTQVDTPALVAGTSQNVFLSPVAGNPGIYAGWLKFNTLARASGYLEFTVDNAQTVAGSYTQKAVTVKKSQLFRKPPASFMSAKALAWRNDNKIFFENFNGLQDVTIPLFAPGTDGKDYLTFQCRRYDMTGDGVGGGVGSVLEDVFNARRSGEASFQPIHQLTDVGLNEFAMKASTWGDQHQGGNVHGGQKRTAPPLLYVDDVLQADPNARRSYGAVNKVVWIEQTQIMDRVTPSTAVANLTATKTWEGRSLTLKNEITFLVEIDLLTLYMFMLSPYVNVANNAGLGPVIDQYTLPNAGGAIYVPGTGVSAAYPSQTRFVGSGAALGLQMDIQVLSAVAAEFRSWIQSGSTSRKAYMSSIGVHDGFGLASERVARHVGIGEQFTLETRLTFSKL